MLSYPENTVWYIEARPWNGPKDGQAGFAQVDPVSRGSGVVVTFIKVSETGERKPRSYILTCAHVVRDREDRLLEDIVCYPPSSGYVRTGENSRRCGTFPNAEAQPAKVSKLSPCCAALGPRPVELKNTLASDWVLLEIEDPSFYHQQSIRVYGHPQERKDGTLKVIGFPFGAGMLAEKQKAEAEGRGKDYPFWKDGRTVKATLAENFRLLEHAEPGILDYEGPEEARPGMSGGGVFDDDGVLVAIHRSSTDSTMRRGSVRSESIVRSLHDTHQMEFAPGKKVSGHGKDWRAVLKMWSGIAAAFAILWLLVTVFWQSQPTKPNPILLKVYARHLTEERGIVPVSGLRIGFESDQWPGVSIDGETDPSGLAQITFTPNSAPKTGDTIFGHLVCRNEPSLLGDDTPFILVPHGRMADRVTKEMQIPITRGAVDCLVMGKRAYLGGLLTRAFANSEREAPPVNGNSPQNLIGAITDISSLKGFTEEETQFATEGWSENLKKERPVVTFNELGNYLPADAAALRKLAGAVGRFRVEDGRSPYSSSAFLIADNLALVPDYALPSSVAASKMLIDFPNPGGVDSITVVKVAWRSGRLGVALCEISKTQRLPLNVGIRKPTTEAASTDFSLSGRKIVVLGFPNADSRLPREINDLFIGVGNQLAVMSGRILPPTEGKAENVEMSHDATTSAGVGGGPVIDLDSLSVIAMHKGGIFTGERKENQATALEAVWDDSSFLEALRPYELVLTESLGAVAPDPLRLSKADRFVSGYIPTFLGCSIPLPMVVSKLAENEPNIRLLDYVNFSIHMHPERRMALFAAANIDRSLLGRVRRERDVWYFDPRISRDAQFGEEIYSQNEFDRGHLIARTAVAWGPTFGYSEKAASSVFYWSNATPQHMHFNQSGWMKLERKVYEELQPESKRLSVFCGPVFDPSDIKERDALVPRRFWMIAVYENSENAQKPIVHAFLAEQYRFDAATEPVFVGRSDDCVKQATVEEIQSVTGLRFSIPK